MIANVINAMGRFLSVPLDSQTEFIIKGVRQVLSKIIPSKATYNKKKAQTDKRKKNWGNPIIDKLMHLKYRINDVYHSGYDDVVRDDEGIDDKNYVMKLIQDVRKGEFTKLSREDGLKCNGLWRKYAN